MKALRAAVLLAVVPAMVGAQGAPRRPIEGAWKIVEFEVTGAKAAKHPSPQPGLAIFGQKHYSLMWVAGAEARALYKSEEPTSEEKLAAFDSFIANSGTYEVSGSTITVRPLVSRSPNFMAGGSSKYEFRVEGNSLWLTEKSTDHNLRIGERVVPSSRAREIRLKLVRVE